MKKAACIGLVVAFAFVAGCNDNDLGPKKKRPNRPPETLLSSGPPDSVGPGGPRSDISGTTYKVHLFWSGSDRDGTIDHYDFILVDHPAIDDSINEGATNQVRVLPLPGPEDPRWSATNANDTLIVTRADTLRRGPRPGPGESASDVLNQSFERWHTFFVRAVDNEGLADPTPEYRSFNSTTLAPYVSLKTPVRSCSDFSGPPVSIFNWDGEDPIGDGNSQKPIASRWVVLRSRKTPNGDFIGWPDSLYLLRPSRWTSWHRWDALDKSGVRAIVTNLLPASDGGGFYIFAVQAMDDAGAVTPVFDDCTPGKNNATKITVITGSSGPSLIVQDKFLGTFNFSSAGPGEPPRAQVQDVAVGQSIHFRWRGDASRYGGEIVAYRYGWNIRNPSNDEEWEQSWSATARDAPVRVFNSGTQRFFLECRDNAEQVTHAEFELVVHQVTRGRELLLVDDSLQPLPDDPREGQEDRRWLAVIDSLQLRRSFQFDRSRDVFDVTEARNNPPPLSKVFDYKTVVWCVSTTSRPGLWQLALFFDPYPDRNRDRVAPFNYVNTFIENRGELWVNGVLPSHAVWELGIQGVPFDRQLPVNVTRTNDPVQPHPEIDSVGTPSLLYKMGIEYFDVGSAGPRTPDRSTLGHACTGLRRAVPQVYDRQTFVSSRDAEHTHSLIILTADVEAAPATGVTYSTNVQVEHSHTVFVAQGDFKALQRGNRVTVTTSSSDSPSPHTHTFELVDQVGLWGAPPVLETDVGWAYPADPIINPWRGRSNIEIYNMPLKLANAQPALRPPAWRSVVLYTYVSGVTADSLDGVLYPQTADGQPVFLLTRAKQSDPYYSRAWCGFEPYLLKFNSHLTLADFVLLRHMRLGLPESP